jgi:hypothetical protein
LMDAIEQGEEREIIIARNGRPAAKRSISDAFPWVRVGLVCAGASVCLRRREKCGTDAGDPVPFVGVAVRNLGSHTQTAARRRWMCARRVRTAGGVDRLGGKRCWYAAGANYYWVGACAASPRTPGAAAPRPIGPSSWDHVQLRHNAAGMSVVLPSCGRDRVSASGRVGCVVVWALGTDRPWGINGCLLIGSAA